ncbi:MAG: hypothetical protein ACI90V_008459, partial [Bacillariaceae sp.]
MAILDHNNSNNRSAARTVVAMIAIATTTIATGGQPQVVAAQSLSSSSSSLSSLSSSSSSFLSEDEVEEAYDRTRSRTQIALDPLQVCLYPTYLNLPSDKLQNDMRDSLQDLVSQQLQQDYGDDFIYFALTTDAKIEWYSGEEKDPICGSLDHMLPVGSYSDSNAALANKRDVLLPYSSDTSTSTSGSGTTATATAPPCTCALYKGAVVLLKSSGEEGENEEEPPTQELLEPKIEFVLQDGLVDSLRDRGSVVADATSSPFYTELKGAIVTWNAAERQQGDGKLVLRPSELPAFNNDNDNDNNESGEAGSQQQLRKTQPPTATPVIVILDGSNTDSTYIDIVGATPNSLEQQQQQSSENNNSANGFQTRSGIILACVLGGL